MQQNLEKKHCHLLRKNAILGGNPHSKLVKMKQNKKRLTMWYKVQELKNKGLKISQIARETGLDRGTVSRYLVMEEGAFHQWLGQGRNVPLKLAPYLNFVRDLLLAYPYLSAAQVEDRLREQFAASLPAIHSKTVYNFVQTVRSKYQIPKPVGEPVREFEQLPPVDYGLQAQVDFGETYLYDNEDKRIKVHFFVMVLCRSRQKFIYFEKQSFTAAKAVCAHELAFQYFEGIPKEIIYDQDSVFISDENLGDYKLTAEFTAYCKSRPFKPVFCRKSDPQSKGKVENVVKYVKQNFLRGRRFSGLDVLNHAVKEWLMRTANAKIHSTTQKIPQAEWQIEKTYMQEYQSIAIKPVSPLKSYNVRKDNTLSYKSNFYSLPLGTYQGKSTKVLVEEKEEKLYIYSADKELITMHNVHQGKGEQIRNSGHWRGKSQSCEKRQEEVLKMLGNSPNAQLYLEGIRQDKGRYYHDNLIVIQKTFKEYPLWVVEKSLVFCLENKQFNGSIFCKVIETFHKEMQSETSVNLPKDITVKPENMAQNATIEVEQSQISTYEKLF